ncbi:hypothetical protein VE00_07110 [Pseudogymnoascus sp. WSF 3629]|nr:hypothetical protein VE00_07110 [Pseudogymnoascus sp. WSF 3629]
MDSIRWLLPGALLSLAMLRLRSKPLPADSSILSKLPPELVLRIASYLPPASAGAFSLCSKRLYAVLAIPYLKCQRGHAAFKTAEFLKLLEPSLPNHIACYYCNKLHQIKHAQRHIQLDKRCDIIVNEAMRTYIHPRFSYVVFRMVMKRYRQGLDHASLLRLLSYEDMGGTFGETRTDTSCRVVDGSLLVRQQSVFVVHPRNRARFPDMKTTICPHAKELHGKVNFHATGRESCSMAYTPGSVDVDRTPTVVRCDSCSYYGTKDEGNWSGLIRCRICATEFRIDVLAVGKEGQAYVVTRWKDLGEGRDVEDPVWLAHVDKGGVATGPRKRVGRRSICERFEGKGWRGGLESLVSPKEMKRVINYKYCGDEV